MNKNILTGIYCWCLMIILAGCSNKIKDTDELETEAIVVQETGNDFAKNIRDKIYFDYDDDEISESAKKTLDEQCEYIKEHSNVSVSLEGNCDQRGTGEYNLALGLRRANAVLKHLVSTGIEKTRVAVRSNGKERAMGIDEEAYAKDRNVTTSVS